MDWLEVTVKQIKGRSFHQYDPTGQLSEVISFPNNVHLIRRKNKSGHSWQMTKSYSAVYDVLFAEEHIAELRTASRFGKDDYSQIKILNHLLYSDRWPGILETILETIEAEINNFTRLDIAIDGRGHLDTFELRRYRVKAGELRKVGRAKTTIIESKQYEIEGFNVGNRKSGKYLTGYRKGETILKAIEQGRNAKQYITQFWKDNGLIGTDDEIGAIERLELKLTADRLRKIEDLTIDNVQKPAFLAGVFRLEMENFYQWTEATTDTNTTRAKAAGVVHAIAWDQLPTEQAKREQVEAQAENSVLWSARMTISHHMREFFVFTRYAHGYANKQADTAISFCRSLAERYGIVDWFTAKLATWENDYDRQQAMRERMLAAQMIAA